MMNAAPIIQVRDVTFAFNHRPVLERVSLEVCAGDFLAVIGPNGGGKTTLLKLMLGLLKPQRGTIRVLGSPPGAASDRIGYVPQNIHVNRAFPVSALDVVLMGKKRRPGQWSRHTAAERTFARDILERLEMGACQDCRVGELSGGQMQRVLIARALAGEPELLFLDEPTANIDSRGQNEFYALLKDLNRTLTIVMVSHDLMMLSSHVTSVACVNQSVHHHNEAEITDAMVDMYSCPVELLAHGQPHRVLKPH